MQKQLQVHFDFVEMAFFFFLLDISLLQMMGQMVVLHRLLK